MSKAPTESKPGKDVDDRSHAAIDRRSFLASGAAVVAIAEASPAPTTLHSAQ